MNELEALEQKRIKLEEDLAKQDAKIQLLSNTDVVAGTQEAKDLQEDLRYELHVKFNLEQELKEVADETLFLGVSAKFCKGSSKNFKDARPVGILTTRRR